MRLAVQSRHHRHLPGTSGLQRTRFDAGSGADRWRSATCPDGKLKGSRYAVLFDKSSTLCFMLNLEQGHCYSVEGNSDNPIFVESARAGPIPVVRVVERIDGEYARSLCPDETKTVFYLMPAQLYCLQPLKT